MGFMAMSNQKLNIDGVKCAAVDAKIKDNGKPDLSLIRLNEGAKTAAVFTQNVFCAAPVLIAKNHLTHQPKALLINSGNANAGTGQTGIKNCLHTCACLANELNIQTEEVLPFSTGVIGQQLNIEKFNQAIPKAVTNLSDKGMEDVSQAILTTDLVNKTATAKFKVDTKTVSISGIAKGSGMIRPNMATMLGFIFTDIESTQDKLQECLELSVNRSFNRITVDGDTSTNDACTLSATGLSGVDISDCADAFQQALDQVTLSLAQQVIKDGEGATKFVEVCVKGGQSNDDCLEVAYTVAHSPLVKTALFASDANWGRILAAVGRANIKELNIEDIDIYLNDVCIVKSGEPDSNYTEDKGSAQMAKSEIVITIKVGNTNHMERVWTSDFSYDYVKINAEYRT